MGRKKKIVEGVASDDLAASLHIATDSFVDDSDAPELETVKGDEPGEMSPPGDEIPVVSIVIPYVASTARWDELRMALRSIAANLIFHYRLFIVADKLPDWVSDEVTLIPCEQVQGLRFAKSFDAVKKLKAVLLHPEVSEDFIYTYDDTVFLKKEHSLVQAMAVSGFPLQERIQQWDGSVIWKEVLCNTIQRLTLNKLPLFNYETHLPRVFNKTRLNDVFNRYGFEKMPYLVSSIYFNDRLEAPDLLLEENPDIKVDIRCFLTTEEIEKAMANKSFLNYNDQGLNEELKEYLLQRFPDKCSLER